MRETLDAPKLYGDNSYVREIQEQLDDSKLRVMGFHNELSDDSLDGLYVSAEFPEHTLGIQVESIDEEKSLQVGANDSHHGVRFAQLSFRDPYANPLQVLVAVKSYDDAVNSAKHEVDMQIAVRERGLQSLEPFGIIKNGDRSYVLTLFNDTIISLDNQIWSAREGEGYENIRGNLQFMGETLASWHASGLFHGDCQPKNFTRTDRGESVVVDLEEGSTLIHDEESHIDALSLDMSNESLALRDLRVLWKTLNRPIGLDAENIFLGQDASPQEMYECFTSNFLFTYLQTLREQLPVNISSRVDIELLQQHFDELIKRDLGI